MAAQQPPKFPLLFLHWFCDPVLVRSIEGDLTELFHEMVDEKGLSVARRQFTWEVIKLIRPELVRSFFRSNNSNMWSLFKHSLLITVRGMKKRPAIFLLNITGLTAGLLSAILILLWVKDEFQKDQFHENKDRLFQLVTHFHAPEEIGTGTNTPSPLAEALAADQPQIKQIIAMRSLGDQSTLVYKNRRVKAKGEFASPGLFETFTFPLVIGSKTEVLKEARSIVLSERLANSFESKPENLIGQMIELDGGSPYLITGIMADIPNHSTLNFDFVLPFIDFTAHNAWADNWNYSTISTFVLLKDQTKPDELNEQLADYLNSRRDGGLKTTLEAIPFTDQYLYGKYVDGKPVGGRIDTVRLFLAIAIFILLIACINFINLSTASATLRAKEVGIKKVVGSGQKPLIFQFLGEAFLVSTFSFLLAALLASVLLPYFNQLTGKSLSWHLSASQVLAAFTLVFITALTAGCYPALYLSRLEFSKILGKSAGRGGKSGNFRQALVVFQFSLSTIMITSLVVVNKQVAFMQKKDIGYDYEKVMYFNIEHDLKDRLEVLLYQINQIPHVVSASSMGQHIVGRSSNYMIDQWKGQPKNEVAFEMRAVNFGLLETLGMTFKEGRSFSPEMSKEENKIIFNEAAIRFMGIVDPIGTTVSFGLHDEPMEIIGVVEDFHYESFHHAIDPMFFICRPGWNNSLMVKFHTSSSFEAIESIEKILDTYITGIDFDFRFVEDDISKLFDTEQRLQALSTYFSGIAILISCLGLFGLTHFSIERRRKEIGVRRVLGATTKQISTLLSKRFLQLIALSLVLSFPISWYFLGSWLDDFTFRITMPWEAFVISGLLALCVTVFTVSYHSIRAAFTNPTSSLRSE